MNLVQPTHVSHGNQYPGILSDESYRDCRALVVLSVCHLDVNTTPELKEPTSYKLSVIICNDGIHDTI